MMPSNTWALGDCPDMHLGRPIEISSTKHAFFYQERSLVTVLAVPLNTRIHAHLQLRGLRLTKILMYCCNVIRPTPLGCFAREIIFHGRPT